MGQPDGSTRRGLVTDVHYEDEGCWFPLSAVLLALKIPGTDGVSLTVYLPGQKLSLSGDEMDTLLKKLQGFYTIQTVMGWAQAFWEDTQCFVPFSRVGVVQKLRDGVALRGMEAPVVINGQAANHFIERLQTYTLCLHAIEEDI